MTHDEIRVAIGASPELQALVPDTQALAAHPIFVSEPFSTLAEFAFILSFPSVTNIKATTATPVVQIAY